MHDPDTNPLSRICPIEHKYVKLSVPCQENIL